jgi:hypothetical protein
VRQHLPNRRHHEVFDFYHWGRKFIAGIGRATNYDIREIWINSGRSGEQMETLARDCAVLISLGLQHGVPLSTMRRACMRNLDGSPTGPVGALLDLIDGDEPSQVVLPDAPRAGPSPVELADA